MAWSALGRAERIRTPIPAARITISSGGLGIRSFQLCLTVTGGWPRCAPPAARPCEPVPGIAPGTVGVASILSATGPYGSLTTCPQLALQKAVGRVDHSPRRLTRL